MLKDVGNFIGNKLTEFIKGPVIDGEIDKLVQEICKELISANVNAKYIVELRKNIYTFIKAEKTNKKAKAVRNAVYKCLVDFLDPKTASYKIVKGKQHLIMFVGLQGAGKTTSICKYANFYKKKGFKVGIVCADTFRAGAFDQIKQNTAKINVACFGMDDPDPVKVTKKGVSHFRKQDYEIILVDTSGRHTQEKELFTEMQNIVSSVSFDNIVFVMDAGIGQSAEEQAQGFKNAVSVGGIILTKLDGAKKAGGALSSVAATGCPIEFVGVGEKMEDFQKFNPKTFVSGLLGINDLETMVEKIEDLDINAEEMSSKLFEGSFTLGDFRIFYTQMCSLGPLSNMLKMIPGASNLQLPDEKKLKRINYIFDSMAKSELQSTGDIFTKEPNRVKRVAYGSGTSKEAVMELLQNFKGMRSMAKKILSMPGMAEMFGMDSSKVKPNKNLQMNPDFMKGFDPNLFN